jgi:hypothetical protein
MQEAAFRYGPFPAEAAGDWGGGKTAGWCLKLLWFQDTFPNNRIVVARRVFKELRATTMATWYKFCPPAAYRYGTRNDANGQLTLNNGSEVLFLGLDNPDTATIINGLEINGFLLDQAEEDDEEIFDKLLGRLGRWDKAEVPDWMLAQHHPWPYRHPETGVPQPPPFALVACNRDVKEHWTYQRFHPESKPWQDKYRALGYKLFEMDSSDNRFLSDINKREMAAQDSGFAGKRQWGRPEGAIHTIDPVCEIPGSPEWLEYFREHCTLYRALSHGDAQATVCLWAAVNRRGHIFIFREYVQRNGRISEHRAAITRLSAYERYATNLAHPKLFQVDAKTKDRSTLADEYAASRDKDQRSTALFWFAADDNELRSRDRINEALTVNPTLARPRAKDLGSPRLFFLTANDTYPDGCRQVLFEARRQRRKKIGTENGRPIFSDDRVKDADAPAYDCLRFILNSRASAQAKPSTRPPAGSFAAVSELLLHPRTEGRRRHA